MQVNVADLASPPAVYSPVVTPPPIEAVASLIQAAAASRNPELEIAVRLLAALGGRRGEVCGLQWRDIDLTRRLVTIRRAIKQLPGKPLVAGDVKSHQERSLTIDAGTTAALVAHRTYVEDRAAKVGTSVVKEAYLLAATIDGAEPWKPNRLSQAVERLKSRSAYRGLHDLRHWNASHLLDAGESVVTVAERLGHRDATTTLRVYAHVMPKADQRAADILGAALDE